MDSSEPPCSSLGIPALGIPMLGYWPGWPWPLGRTQETSYQPQVPRAPAGVGCVWNSSARVHFSTEVGETRVTSRKSLIPGKPWSIGILSSEIHGQKFLQRRR